MSHVFHTEHHHVSWTIHHFSMVLVCPCFHFLLCSFHAFPCFLHTLHNPFYKISSLGHCRGQLLGSGVKGCWPWLRKWGVFTNSRQELLIANSAHANLASQSSCLGLTCCAVCTLRLSICLGMKSAGHLLIHAQQLTRVCPQIVVKLRPTI